MKRTLLFVIILSTMFLALSPAWINAQEASRLGLRYGGKSFESAQDPGYLSYEREIKPILLEKIRNRYGVELNADLLSSEELLEIDALLRLKRADESVEHILSRFPEVLRQGSSS